MSASLSSFILALKLCNYLSILLETRFIINKSSNISINKSCKLKVIRRRQNCFIYQHYQYYPVRGQCRCHQNSYALFAIQIYTIFLLRTCISKTHCCRNGRLRKNMKLSSASVIQISQSSMLRLLTYAKRSKDLERNVHGNNLSFSHREDKINHRF